MTVRSDLKGLIRARQAKTGESYTAARAHVMSAREASLGLISGYVLKCNDKSLRVRVPGEVADVTLRCSGYDARRIAPAQFIEAALVKRWQWGGDNYASGSVGRVWTDVPALGLTPLALDPHGLYDMNEVHDPVERPDPYAELWARNTSRPRPAFEFDGVAFGVGVGPFSNGDDRHACLIDQSLDADGTVETRQLLMDAVLVDPRCLDAHVHLGNLVIESDSSRALTYYEIAVAIGELSLGPSFDGYLPWSALYNRPFLRALLGQAVCLWRQGQAARAAELFERILSLNPNDNQGARFNLDDIRNQRPWRP